MTSTSEFFIVGENDDEIVLGSDTNYIFEKKKGMCGFVPFCEVVGDPTRQFMVISAANIAAPFRHI